jgi:hypothetical protein
MTLREIVIAIKPKVFLKPKTDFLLRFKLRFYKLKGKLKRIKFNKEKVTINFFIGLAFLSILIGLIIFIVFLYKLSNNYSVVGDNVNMEKSGQTGDFVGGIVGAIWALTGVLLFYATLRLQSKELAENRKHFQMSRLTDIIYKQLDLFNSHLTNFKLKDIERNSNNEHMEYIGRSAITILRHRVERVLDIEKVSKEKKARQKEAFRIMVENYAFIELNKDNLLNIYEELDNHVSVIRAILIKEDIPPSDLNELKSIFFRNVGRDLLNSSNLLGIFLENYLSFKKKQGEKVDDIFSIEQSIKLKIAAIEEFRKKIYDINSIKQDLRHRDIYNETSY